MRIVLDPIGLRNVSAPLRNVLDSLDGVQVSGSGWSARCPAHDDENPSLSVAEGDEGQVLLYCHAGCDIHDIVEALGIELRDLFVHRSRQKKGGC